MADRNRVKPTGYRLDSEDKKRLEKLAEKLGTSKSEALRQAIRKASEE